MDENTQKPTSQPFDSAVISQKAAEIEARWREIKAYGRGTGPAPSRLDGVSLGKLIVAAVRSFVDRKTDPLIKTVAELEAKVAILEDKALAFAGVFSKGMTYSKNDLVLHGGTLWLSKFGSTGIVPGDDSGCWQLVTKHAPRPEGAGTSSRPSTLTSIKGTAA